MLASMTDTVEKFLILVLHLISLFSEILLVEQAMADALVEHLPQIVGSPPFYQEHLFLAQVQQAMLMILNVIPKLTFKHQEMDVMAVLTL